MKTERKPTRESRVDWHRLVTDDEWALYESALDSVDRFGVRVALGGGLAFSELSGRARHTKDLDLYVLPKDREASVEALSIAGYDDLYDLQPYDRSWIFRGTKGGVIVDIIWTSPNHRMVTDEAWVECGPLMQIRNRMLRLLPPEELIWAKLYVMQKDRCDWTDLLNVMNGQAHTFDWERLVERVGDQDAPLLGGLLSVFRWLCPTDAARIPGWVWPRLGLLSPEDSPSPVAAENRAPILDSRDWFGPKGVQED